MISKKEALKLAEKFHINLDIVGIDQWIDALNTELEHGDKLGKMTNITKNNSVLTAMIAIAHLIEDPHYYKYLKKMEDESAKFWKGKKKPNIFL